MQLVKKNIKTMLLTQSELDVPKRFWPKIALAGDDECWEWQAAKFTNFPYGAFGVTWKQTVLAHRFMFETYCGAIPPGLNVLHSCDNPPCVNPNHLFLGTHQDNQADMRQKGRAAGMPNCPDWSTKIKDFPPCGLYVRLTPEQELAITADTRTGVELAKIYGVHRATIDRARHRQGVPVKYRSPSPKKRRDGDISV